MNFLSPTGATLHHWSGELVAKNAGCTLGLHQLALQLQDDDGGSHMVYIAHGRGPQAQAWCQLQFSHLHIGARYHGTATLRRVGEAHTWWMGAVTVNPCQRRPRFALVAAEQAAAAAGAPA